MPKFMPDWIQEVGAWVECLFEQHRFVRRSVILLASILLAFITVWTFRDPSVVTGGTATAYVGFTTMYAAILGFYGHGRDK
jgi:hypothetical protein